MTVFARIKGNGKHQEIIPFTVTNCAFLDSLGIAVINRQFWRQFDLPSKSCRPPAVQLLA